eukprot:4493616-Amphidinium_carterae.1
MASHPESSFHQIGNNGIPSRVVSPSSWHHWHPIQSCHSIKLASMASHPELSFHQADITGMPSRAVIAGSCQSKCLTELYKLLLDRVQHVQYVQSFLDQILSMTAAMFNIFNPSGVLGPSLSTTF